MHALTNSALTTFRRCEEKYRLAFLQRLSPFDEGTSRSIGSAVHKGIELLDAQAGVDWIREALGPPYTPAEREAVEVAAATVEAIVTAALKQWPEWPDQREVEFVLPLQNPTTEGFSTRHHLAGKIDGLWEDLPESVIERQGLQRAGIGRVPAVLEIKTTSRFDQTYVARLTIDTQPTTYTLAGSIILDQLVDLVLYRVIRTPGIKRLSKVKRPDVLDEKGKPTYSPETVAEYCDRIRREYAEKPEKYLHEFFVHRAPTEHRRFRHETWELHQRILAVERGQMTVRNTGSCVDFGRCDFLDLCSGAVGPEAYRVRATLNPELED